MKNFTLDIYLSQRLRKLSDTMNKSEIEVLEEMFTNLEENLSWKLTNPDIKASIKYGTPHCEKISIREVWRDNDKIISER